MNPLRLTLANSAEINPEGQFVLYWMTSQRRPHYNFALQRAADWAQRLGKPLLIFEALRYDYPWASPRLHQWVLDGMLAQQEYFAAKPCEYFPYLEGGPGQARGLLESLASRASLVVGDEFPCFFLPAMQAAVAARLSVRFELVDGNGLIPLRSAPKAYERALDFRRFLQKNLPAHLEDRPKKDPLAGLTLPRLEQLPERQQWPCLLQLPDQLTGPPTVAGLRGGFQAAQQRLQHFLKQGLDHYLQRSDPGREVSSGLSPYLHFGQISVHQVLIELVQGHNWNPNHIQVIKTGSKDGSWGLPAATEAYLDELVTWRELGYNFCHYRPQDFHRYESLPEWARLTLEEHSQDPRPALYSLEQFDQASTHDPLWNAAQRQLRQQGLIHNYLRMLWGKKILEWSPHPRQALEVMIELNNRYALDGRNPNSYSGIFWCLGRYDRPWFKRPIFGTIRYMSSDAAAKKFKLESYLQRWS